MVLLRVATVAFGATGMWALASGRARSAQMFGVVAVLVAFALPRCWLAFRWTILRVHTNGVRVVRPLGEVAITFDDVASFSYSVVRQHVQYNGGDAYVGTFVAMAFTSKRGGVLRYEFSTTSRDAAVDDLRDRLTRRMAAEWRREVLAGHQRRWAGKVMFARQGLIVPGYQGIIRYNRIADCRLADGRCWVMHTNGTELATFLTNAPNFFPGLELLHLLNAPQIDGEPGE